LRVVLAEDGNGYGTGWRDQDGSAKVMEAAMERRHGRVREALLVLQFVAQLAVDDDGVVCLNVCGMALVHRRIIVFVVALGWRWWVSEFWFSMICKS